MTIMNVDGEPAGGRMRQETAAVRRSVKSNRCRQPHVCKPWGGGRVPVERSGSVRVSTTTRTATAAGVGLVCPHRAAHGRARAAHAARPAPPASAANNRLTARGGQGGDAHAAA